MINAIQKPSPNFNKGRDGYKVECVSIHIMDGSLIGTNSWFANPISQVSSHYGVGLKGEIVKYISEEDTAYTQGYHEGATFKLHKPGVNPNKYFISIENEGTDLSNASPEQLQSLVSLIKDICGRYALPVDRDHIIGHYEVDPIRKPNCPTKDRTLLDKLILMCQNTTDEMISIQCPKSKAEKIKKIIEII